MKILNADISDAEEILELQKLAYMSEALIYNFRIYRGEKNRLGLERLLPSLHVNKGRRVSAEILLS
jgi:DNA polymerase III delta prime subunit